MRDFYPEDMAIRNHIFQVWHNSARLHGFLNYDSCVVENLSLLKRKAGEEITEQIYSFIDKSNRELALRPEMTPTLARMLIARQNSMQFPAKWYTIAQCFRYERMSKGRKREHFQWNLDIAGEPSTSAEAEIIAAAITAMRALGLTAGDIKVRINSRALMAELLIKHGIQQEHTASVFMAIDKYGKIPEPEIVKMLTAACLSEEGIKAVFEIMKINSIDAAKSAAGDESPAMRAIIEIWGAISTYGLTDFIEFDMSVVRGLGYYTGIVFECYDIKKEHRAIFGGGRYDNLISDLGGNKIPCVGMGFGDVVIAELLAEKGLLPTGSAPALVAVGCMDKPSMSLAIEIAVMFRNNGESVDLALAPEKPKNFFSRCSSAGFDRAVYIGPDDVKSRKIRIKDLKTRQETELSL